jgi:hypothetical protein
MEGSSDESQQTQSGSSAITSAATSPDFTLQTNETSHHNSAPGFAPDPQSTMTLPDEQAQTYLMPTKKSNARYWGPPRVQQYFNTDRRGYDILMVLLKADLEREQLLGLNFQKADAKARLHDCIRKNLASYPAFVSQGGPEIPVLIGLAQGINARYRSQERYAGSDAGSGPAHNGVPSDVQMKSEVEPAFPGALADISASPPGDGSQTQLQTELNQQIQEEILATSTGPPLETKTIVVRNLADPNYNGLCAVKDLLPKRGHDSAADAEIDNLDYDRFLDFLRQDCCYSPDQHVLTCGDAGDKLFINSQWSWRAAMREISRMEPQCPRFIFELTEKGEL